MVSSSSPRLLPAVLNRHDNKHFVARGPGEVEIEADGYSEAQVRRLLDASSKLVQECESR